VITFPAVLLLITAAVQAGLFFHARQLAQAAAQEGLRAARQYQASTAAGYQAATGLLERTAGDLLTARTVTVDRSTTTATVEVDGTAVSLLPGLSFHVSATARGPVERLTRP
jgi:Flp pilus assembly protein TadG